MSAIELQPYIFYLENICSATLPNPYKNSILAILPSAWVTEPKLRMPIGSQKALIAHSIVQRFGIRMPFVSIDHAFLGEEEVQKLRRSQNSDRLLFWLTAYGSRQKGRYFAETKSYRLARKDTFWFQLLNFFSTKNFQKVPIFLVQTDIFISQRQIIPWRMAESCKLLPFLAKISNVSITRSRRVSPDFVSSK